MGKGSLSFYSLFILLSWSVSSFAATCSFDDWCLMSSGTTETLWGIWGTDGNNVFAVGDNSSIHHFDGSKWRKMESLDEFTLRGIWGSSKSNIYAVGVTWPSGILHYDGSKWNQEISGVELQSIWGSDYNDIFAVGGNMGGGGGHIVHYDGFTWSKMGCPDIDEFGNKPYLYDVWGSSGNDVYAVGSGGAILHYDGVEWSLIKTSHYLNRVWGSGPNDVFAVGGRDSGTGDSFATILHYDGTSWSEMDIEGGRSLNGVWGSSPNDVYAVESAMGVSGVVWHYDGITWSPMESSTTKALNRIWGSNRNDIFAVGYDGTIIRRHLTGPFKLSVVVSGNGTVKSEPSGIFCPPDCTQWYDENMHVTLKAVPAKEAVFGSWSEGTCKSTGPCTVKMDRNRRIEVNFGKEGGVPGALLLLLRKKEF